MTRATILLPAAVAAALALGAVPARAGLADRAAAAGGDANAVLRLGVVRDTESIPMLLDYAEKRPDSDDVGHAARLALARMGDQSFEKPLIRGLSRKKPRAARLRCLRALGYVGDRAAVKHIIPLLGEKGEVSNTAVEALGEILPQVQTYLLLSEPGNADRAGQWRRWWNDSKQRNPELWQ